MPPSTPTPLRLAGRHCAVEPLDPARHAGALHPALTADPADWTYKADDPPPDRASFDRWLAAFAGQADPMTFAIVMADGRPAGLAAYLRIAPVNGTIEIGHIHYGPDLKRTRAGTEAMLLLMRHAMSLGYRRLEWKCDSLNAPSRAAALRYGFTYEGTFRNALVIKQRNRDTAWYAVTDEDWPAIRADLEQWLDDANFDEHGRQRRSLRELTRPRSAAPSAEHSGA